MGLILKNHLIIYCLTGFLVIGGEKPSMNRKIKVLALISVIVVATIAASLVLAMQSTVKANTTTLLHLM